MNQTRKHSFLESLTNIAIGYFVALGSQTILFPMVGVHVPFSTNVQLSIYFTIISLVRSYLLRRFFTCRFRPTPTA
jgi:membrane protein implicated in regulation of membrane protease activity